MIVNKLVILFKDYVKCVNSEKNIFNFFQKECVRSSGLLKV